MAELPLPSILQFGRRFLGSLWFLPALRLPQGHIMGLGQFFFAFRILISKADHWPDPA